VNEDRLVTAGLAHGGSVDEHAAWINQLEDYYGDELVARCPDDKSIHWKTPVAGTDPPQVRRSSYGTNYYTVKRIGDKGPYNRLSMFRRPGSTIFMVELAEKGGYAASDHVHPETWFLDPPRQAAQEMQYERHLGRANYSFIDAHVEPLRFEKTYKIGGLDPNGYMVFDHNKYDPAIAH
jgi:prepilin-type processing-associated H-X9-DG protein